MRSSIHPQGGGREGGGEGGAVHSSQAGASDGPGTTCGPFTCFNPARVNSQSGRKHARGSQCRRLTGFALQLTELQLLSSRVLTGLWWTEQ